MLAIAVALCFGSTASWAVDGHWDISYEVSGNLTHDDAFVVNNAVGQNYRIPHPERSTGSDRIGDATVFNNNLHPSGGVVHAPTVSLQNEWFGGIAGTESVRRTMDLSVTPVLTWVPSDYEFGDSVAAPSQVTVILHSRASATASESAIDDEGKEKKADNGLGSPAVEDNEGVQRVVSEGKTLITRCLKASDNGKIHLDTVHVKGEIFVELSASYGEVGAGVYASVSLEIVDFGMGSYPDGVYANYPASFKNAPDKQEFDAWVNLKFKDDGVPEHPLIPFWAGSADFILHAKLIDPTHPQDAPAYFEHEGYSWSADEEYQPAVLPPTKEIHIDWDLGGDPNFDGFPKVTNMTGVLGAAVPQTNADENKPNFTGRAKIHWHSPWENAGLGTEPVLIFPPTTPVQMGDGTSKHISQVEVGDVVLRNDPPAEEQGWKWQVTGTDLDNNTGLVTLHLAVYLDPDENPDNPGYDENQYIKKIVRAQKDAVEEGAAKVKLALETYKSVAEFYATGPFYALGETIVIQGGLKAVELLRIASEAGVLASRVRAISVKATELATRIRGIIQQGHQTEEEIAQLTTTVTQLETDAAKLTSTADKLECVATRTTGLAHDTVEGVEAVGCGAGQSSGASIEGILADGSAAPGTLPHKAARWQEYEERGGQWGYQRWGKTYEHNMHRASDAHAYADAIRAELGWGEREFTAKINGEIRRLDIAEVDTVAGIKRGVEVKSGYVCNSQAVRDEIRKDAALVGEGWTIRWIVKGRVSQQLRDALENANILLEVRP